MERSEYAGQNSQWICLSLSRRKWALDIKKQAPEKMTFLRKNQAKNLINNEETLVLPKERTLPKKQDPRK